MRSSFYRVARCNLSEESKPALQGCIGQSHKPTLISRGIVATWLSGRSSFLETRARPNSADFLTDPCGVILHAKPPPPLEHIRSEKRPLLSTARVRRAAAAESGKRAISRRRARGRGCKSRRKMSRRCDTRYYPPQSTPGSRNDLTSPTFAVAPFRGDKKDEMA